MEKVLVINGSNVNIQFDNDMVNEDLAKFAKQYELDVDFFQSNIEGELIDTIQEAAESGEYKAILLNPGSNMSTSVGLKDICTYAEMKKGLPTICVSLDNNLKVPEKELNLVGKGCFSIINGLGAFVYHIAIVAVANIRKEPKKKSQEEVVTNNEETQNS